MIDIDTCIALITYLRACIPHIYIYIYNNNDDTHDNKNKNSHSEKGEVFLRGVGTLRYLFLPDASVQWQPDGLTIHTKKWFLGAGFLGAPPISLSHARAPLTDKPASHGKNSCSEDPRLERFRNELVPGGISPLLNENWLESNSNISHFDYETWVQRRTENSDMLQPVSEVQISGSCRCAIIGVPWCLRRLNLFSTCLNNVLDKQITPG